tara:strand:+ start:2481 stop:3662 length:1182 start_codon:yes stop_codon:yes gene_type:complete
MKIAFLTSGGNAPCLNSSIGRLLHRFGELNKNVYAIGYLNGFSGLLKGKSIKLPTQEVELFYEMGGSLIGNSRVKLTNIEDCIQKKLITERQVPLEVAANQLIEDEIDILFTIGGDDTNTTARDLQNYINSKDVNITVIGIPKTIDNDIFPVKRSLGAYTAASEGAKFFKNIVSENFMGERHLIVHEIMGRNSGWLTAYTAREYLGNKITFDNYNSLNSFFDSNRFDIHGLYVPERAVDIKNEIKRLSKVLKEVGCLNLFICEGAFLSNIKEDARKKGNIIEKDAFGHEKLDSVNAAKWFSSLISKELDFDRILIQKSGYFARSASPNTEDLDYIFKLCDFAFKNALESSSGVVGEDERTGNLSCIDFNDIKGDKGLDITSDWFLDIIESIEK